MLAFNRIGNTFHIAHIFHLFGDLELTVGLHEDDLSLIGDARALYQSQLLKWSLEVPRELVSIVARNEVRGELLIAYAKTDGKFSISDGAKVAAAGHAKRLVNFQISSSRAAISSSLKFRLSKLDPAYLVGQQELLASLGTWETSQVIGSGPSLEKALGSKFNGPRLTSNLIVTNPSLFNVLQPKVHVATDPVAHFSLGDKALRFRHHLRKALVHNPELLVATSEHFAPILIKEMPEIANRLLAVPWSKSGTWNFDLKSEYSVRPTSNVLTMLMLPLAATMSNTVEIFGADGRTGSHGAEFWKPSDLIEPGPNYNDARQYIDFYSVANEKKHVEHLIEAREAALALFFEGKKLHVPIKSEYFNSLGTGKVIIVSLCPFWKDEFGHFRKWEKAQREAAFQMGYGYLTLANKELDTAEGNVFPWFRSKSPSGVAQETISFLKEAEMGLSGFDRILVFDYFSSIAHAVELESHSKDFPKVEFIMNVMRSNGQLLRELIQPGIGPVTSEFLKLVPNAADGRAKNFEAIVDSGLIANLLRARGQRVPRVLPFISPELEISSESSIKSQQGRNGVKVLIPSSSRPEKGHGKLPQLIRECLSCPQVSQVIIRITNANTRTSRTLQKIAKAEDRLRIVFGSLSVTEYNLMFEQADLVVIPYDPREFAVRTSGVLAEAAKRGLPFLVPQHTWMAHQLNGEALSNLATFDFFKKDSLAKALSRYLENPDANIEKFQVFFEDFLESTQARNFINVLLGDETSRSHIDFSKYSDSIKYLTRLQLEQEVRLPLLSSFKHMAKILLKRLRRREI